MKKITQNLRWLVTLLAMIVSMGAWAAETTKTVDLSAGTYSDGSITWTIDGKITIQQTKGGSQTAVNKDYISAPRIYKGQILSFVASNGTKIKSISITYSGSYYGNSMTAGTVLNDNTVTDNPTDVARTWSTSSGGTHVVSSVSVEGLSQIYIQNVAHSESKQLRPTVISVTYTTGIQTNVTFNSSYISRTDMAQGTELGQLIAIVKDINNTLITNPTINWESSNEGVATVDANGNVKAVNIGTTIITATFAGDDTYLSSSAEYVLTVTNSSCRVSTLVFISKCNGSGTANDGVSWSVTSDATESTYDGDRGIHYGTSKAAVSYRARSA